MVFPPVIPISVNAASPGPFTTQPIIDNVKEFWYEVFSKILTVSITWKACLAQDGHEIILTIYFKIDDLIFHFHIYFTGSSDKILLSIPIPSNNKAPKPIDDFMVSGQKIPQLYQYVR